MTGLFFRNLRDDGFKNQDSKKATLVKKNLQTQEFSSRGTYPVLLACSLSTWGAETGAGVKGLHNLVSEQVTPFLDSLSKAVVRNFPFKFNGLLN